MRHLLGPAVAVTTFALIMAARAPSVSSRHHPGRGDPPGADLPSLLSFDSGAATSLEALAARVVAALARSDREALRGLTVTRPEYRALLFPRMDLDRHAGPDFYFDNLTAGSLRDLERALSRLGGRHLQLVAVTVDPAEVERYGELVIHRGVTLRLEVDGRIVESELLGGVVEHQGRFKLTRYRSPEQG